MEILRRTDILYYRTTDRIGDGTLLNLLAARPNASGIHHSQFTRSENGPGENMVTFFCFCRKFSTTANTTPSEKSDNILTLSETYRSFILLSDALEIKFLRKTARGQLYYIINHAYRLKFREPFRQTTNSLTDMSCMKTRYEYSTSTARVCGRKAIE